jgi:hypothetical protein
VKPEIRDKLTLIKQTDRDTPKCIFCGVSPTTREHVFARWTHKYMPARKSGRAKSHIAIQHVDRVVGRDFNLPGAIRDWQVKCVCASCNNGWMSGLETAAEPIMQPLLLSQQTRLFEKDCETIATWAILKSTVVHNKWVHHTRRKFLMRARKPPKDWGVWIANYQRQTWEGEWLSWPVSVRTDAEKLAKKPSAYNAHITIQMIKNLYIHVTNLPYQDFATKFRFTRPDGSSLGVVRIWPFDGTSIVWPQKPLLDDDAMMASEAVFRRLIGNDEAARRLAAG